MGPKKHIRKPLDVLKAVVIVDTYDVKYNSLTNHCPQAQWPVAGVPLIRLTIDSLYMSGIYDVILLVKSSNVDQIHRALRAIEPWKKMRVQCISIANCSSVGDAMRELYSKDLLTDEFLFFDCCFASTANFKKFVLQFQLRQRADKNAVGQVLLKDSGCSVRTDETDVSVVFNQSGKIVSYRKSHDFSSSPYVLPEEQVEMSEKRKQQIKEFSVEFKSLSSSKAHYMAEMVECHAAVFTPHLLNMFADNFDYTDVMDAVRGVLLDEEISGNSVYLSILPTKFEHFAVVNIREYMNVCFHLLTDSFLPLSLDKVCGQDTDVSAVRRSLSTHHDRTGQGHSVDSSGLVFIGKDCIVGKNVSLHNTIIGPYCNIGDNVKLKDCIIWQNSSIGPGANVLNSVIGSETTLQHQVSLVDSCVVGCGVIVPKNAVVPRKSVIVRSKQSPGGYMALDFVVSRNRQSFNMWGDALCSSSGTTDDADEETDDDQPAELADNELENVDDKTVVAREIFTMITKAMRGESDSEKLVLEVNGLKHAYNISIRELIELITDSILQVALNDCGDRGCKQFVQSLKNVLAKVELFLKRYIKDEDTQVHFVYSFEMTALKVEAIANATSVVYFELYEQDIIEETAFVRYYKNPLLKGDDKETNERIDILRTKSAPFLTWLETADEEDEDD